MDRAFTYRTLNVDDFQAQSLPEDLESHAKNIAAHACCRIRTTKDTRYKITRGYLNEQIHYFGSIQSVGFEAVMIPECSWLNPDLEEEKLDYVMQHEQIHFALMELAARKLNREAKEEFKHWGCSGPLVIDARIKPHHAPVLTPDKDAAAKSDRFFTQGAILEKFG